MSTLFTVDAPSGAGGENNIPYSQAINLISNSLADVGQCDMEMVVTSNGYLDKDGVTTRYMPEQVY